jgi:cell wall-associated NlpC family hydrolase
MRYRDWPERLVTLIEARRHRPFVWGENDCALFAADAVVAISGVDLAAAHRGTYSDEAGAVAAVAAAGGMRGLVERLSEKRAGLAQRGDVVIADLEGRETFGIVVGGGFWCAPGPDGLVFRPMAEAVAAFGV